MMNGESVCMPLQDGRRGRQSCLEKMHGESKTDTK